MGRAQSQRKVGAKQGVSPVSSTTASSKSCLDPEFLKAIPIMKTRSGMQVCACVGACRCIYSKLHVYEVLFFVPSHICILNIVIIPCV